MKNLTLILALTLPIIWGLDLKMTNMFIALAIWATATFNWLNNEEI